jgi:myo-inositol-1(or 4)-monophosphatase
MTDWLSLCRAARDDMDEVLTRLQGRAAREPVLGEGEGGDDTTAVDAAAEAAILPHFRRDDTRIVSEEAGLVGDGRYTVVIDPIDGSLNAKRGIRFFSLSIAVAEGATMDDVVFGYVYDFGSREEWTAERGRGAFLDGRPLVELPKDELEMVAFEATTVGDVARDADLLRGLVHRLRIMGSLALSLCHLAAGRLDAVVSPEPVRSVDIAAGALLVRERGLAIDLPGDPPFGAAPLDLRRRSRIVAAGTDDLCGKLTRALGL